jgi:glycosyltransferase involved in cell wall biosynthesis
MGPDESLQHIVVVNNGSGIPEEVRTRTATFRYLDINPASSRSLARNTALEHGSESEAVLFLDSGDELLEGVLPAMRMLPAGGLVHGRTEIRSVGKRFRRRNWGAGLSRYVNPFYLGSVVCDVGLLGGLEFEEGRKEDWKFWLQVLEREPEVVRSDEIVYAYHVKSAADHVRRKTRILPAQIRFFREYLGLGPLHTVFALTIHLVLNGLHWLAFGWRKR